MIGALSSRILLYIGGGYVLAVAGLWAAIGVLALFGQEIPKGLELAAAAVTGVGALALLPLGLGLSQMLWEIDRKRVWRSLGDLAAVGVLALVLAAAGFVLIEAFQLLADGQDDNGVPNGNLVATMVFVGGFALLAVLLVVRRSPPPPIQEIALSDILGHAALARKAADRAQACERDLDKAAAKSPIDPGAALMAARGAAECVRISARCAGLTLDQLMRTTTEPRFAQIVQDLGRSARAGLAAHANGLRKINDLEIPLHDHVRRMRSPADELDKEERRLDLAEQATSEAQLAHQKTLKQLRTSKANLDEKQKALDAAVAAKAPKEEIDKKTEERDKAKRESEEIVREATKAESNATALEDREKEIRSRASTLRRRLRPFKNREGDLLEQLRAITQGCVTDAKRVANRVEWAADEAYATVETGEPSESKPAKEKEEEKKPAATPAAATSTAGGGSGQNTS